MLIVLLGAPGSGKGTQGPRLSEKLGLPILSTGNMLRAAIAAKTSLGLEYERLQASGQLVPDKLIVSVVLAELKKPEYGQGAILDGFPRTVLQAYALEEAGVQIHTVIELGVSDDTVISRLAGRRIHPSSGRTYHTLFNPPKIAGRDDLTGELLIQRVDDTEATVRTRLKIYRTQTAAIGPFYKDARLVRQLPHYVTVDAEQDTATVWNAILNFSF